MDIIVQKAFKQATGDKRATHLDFEHFSKVHGGGGEVGGWQRQG